MGIPSVSASSSAQSGATGGAAYGGTIGDFNVTKGTPTWVWIAAAVAVVVFLLWPRKTQK